MPQQEIVAKMIGATSSGGFLADFCCRNERHFVAQQKYRAQKVDVYRSNGAQYYRKWITHLISSELSVL